MAIRTRSREEREKSAPTACDLPAWREAFDLAIRVFRVAENLPLDLGPRLSGQMRIIALSVPSYLARGHASSDRREFLRGAYQARAAVSLLKSSLSFCGEVGLATSLELRQVETQIRRVRRSIDVLVADLRGGRRSNARRRPSGMSFVEGGARRGRDAESASP
ncbi:MAG TPA: four helix bundle protein [Verrucomicrobiae bacterium]|nr:four helix bundle protein [Verrucomicrobiae bacterium]